LGLRTLGSVPDPLVPADGLAVLHLFCRPTKVADSQAVAQAVKAAEADEVQVVPVAMLGHKAEVGFMVLGRDWWRLRRFQTEIEAAGLIVVDSYVSLTEVSEYAAGMPDHMKEPRLRPQLPPEGKTAWCFYPMSKRREVGANWFREPFDRRREMMEEHGRSGRTFGERIMQLVTASTGLDDYEWGVTLFGNHPDDLKDVVYTMRFDEASAKYAEFGPFITGLITDVEEVVGRVTR
jgi:hydrogen peroxide-dependent heme synthase